MRGTIGSVDRRASAAVRMAVLCAVLAGASFGCAAQRGPFGDPENARINIEVQNRGFEDATLHAILNGRRVRLGIVTGTRTANFRLPLAMSALLQIEIDLLAGPECTTREIWADPGDIIVLEIQQGLRFCGL